MLTKIFPNPHFFGYALPVTSTITVRVFLKLLKYQVRKQRQRQITKQLNGWANIISLFERKLMVVVVVTTNH